MKTLPRKERVRLLNFAPAYLAHCRAHPGTLIRYLGCYSIRMPLNTRKVYFVVMANVLPPTPCDLTFDLKGATSNRQRHRRPEDLEALRAGTPPPRLAKTLLDKDWMALGLTLSLPDEEAAGLARTIATDTAFLAAEGLLDYSLLVGIQRPAGIQRPPTADGGSAAGDVEAPSSSDDAIGGGGRGGRAGISASPHTASDGSTFYVGIIDILERWSCGKWPVQACLLRSVFRYLFCMQWHNPRGITALPPADYALRFEEFVMVHMLGLPYASRTGQTWQPFW